MVIRATIPDFVRAGALGLAWLLGTSCAQSTVEILPEQNILTVFGNGRRRVQTQFHNPAEQPTEANLRFRLYQASGSTLMPLGAAQTWKTLTLSGGQTVLESLEVELPSVRGEAVFHIVWFDGERKLGTTQLSAFPDELLKPLAALAGEKPLGLLDPAGQFKAAFSSIPTDELKEAEDVNASEARLILIAPMVPEKRPAGLTAAVKKKAASGTAVVWIQPQTHRHPDLLPETYLIAEGAGQIVVAAGRTVSDLSDSPRAQLNLVRLAELATGRKKLALPADPKP